MMTLAQQIVSAARTGRLIRGIRRRLYGALGMSARVQNRAERDVDQYVRESFFSKLRRAAIEYENDEPVAVVRVRKGVHLDSQFFSLTSSLMIDVRRLYNIRRASKSGPAGHDRRSKIVVASTFPAWPARHGGQQRLLNIYARLCERVDVTLISLSSVCAKLQTVEFGAHFREIAVPQTPAHHKFEGRLRSKLEGMPVTDIAAIHGISLTPMFEDILKRALADATLAVAEHPYCFNALRRVWPGLIV